jgi:hypothetical protein
MKNEKKWITETIDGDFDFDGYNFDTLCDSMIKWKNDNPYHRNFRFSSEHDCGDLYCVKADRLETDKEFKKRIDIIERWKMNDKKSKEDREQKERKLYEKLKKKYEGK